MLHGFPPHCSGLRRLPAPGRSSVGHTNNHGSTASNSDHRLHMGIEPGHARPALSIPCLDGAINVGLRPPPSYDRISVAFRPSPSRTHRWSCALIAGPRHAMASSIHASRGSWKQPLSRGREPSSGSRSSSSPFAAPSPPAVCCIRQALLCVKSRRARQITCSG